MNHRTLFLLLFSIKGFAQTSYGDSLKTFINRYVANHEVVKGEDKKRLQFYKADKSFRVKATFKAATTAGWLSFKTSGKLTKVFRMYGTLSFLLQNKPCQLTLYQSQELMTSEEYKNYLFLPFTDATTGGETYAGGRYIDLTTTDITKNKTVLLDFNKAYNPYCAYVSGIYNCPLPPKENALPIAVKAGEKTFAGSH